MRKYAEKLVKADHNMTVGNHAVTVLNARCEICVPSDGGERWIAIHASRIFRYHGNIIFAVNDEDKTYYATHDGWHTTSTSQALGQYRYWFSREGYMEVREEDGSNTTNCFPASV